MIIEFTEAEADILALGFHDAVLLGGMENPPVPRGDIVRLDLLVSSSQGVLSQNVEEAARVLETCLEFFKVRFRVEVDHDRDDADMMDVIYPIQQDHNLIIRRYNDAIALLRRKLGK